MTRVRGFFRTARQLVFGKPIAQPTRDVLKEVQDEIANQRTLVVTVVASTPLIAVLLVAVILVYRTSGYQGLALAIVENLSVGSIGFIVAVGALSVIIAPLVYAVSHISVDPSFAPRVRRVAGASIVPLLAVAVFSLSWPLASVCIVGCLLSLRLRIPMTGAQTVVPPEQWFGQTSAPADVRLRALWIEGRAWMRSEGKDVAPRLEDSAAWRGDPPRSIAAILPKVKKRESRIREAGRSRNELNAVWSSIGLIASISAISALSAIQFAPLEKVELKGEKPQLGFVFAGGQGAGIFVPNRMNGMTSLDTDPIVSAELCKPSGISVSIVAAFQPHAFMGADCSR